MSSDRRLTRRRFADLLAAPFLLAATGAARSASEKPRDQGIGGTGAVMAPDAGQDRGIGGTGFIGTIQRFGSIIVNDERIAYPPNAAISIDGEKKTARALRIGHVVRCLASSSSGGLSTRSIEVVSEVVGAIEQIEPSQMMVLGQHIALDRIARAGWWRTGARVAVSGIRRTDGVIVASLIERRAAGLDRVAGLVEQDDEGFWIDNLRLSGAVSHLVGERAIAIGRSNRRVLDVLRIAADEPTTMSGAQRLSLQTYVRRDGQDLRLGSGTVFRNVENPIDIGDNKEARVILGAAIEPGGRLRLESIRGDRGAGQSGLPGGRSGGPPGGGPAGQGPRGVGPGGPASGPQTPGRSGFGPPANGPVGPAPGGPPAGGPLGPGGGGLAPGGPLGPAGGPPAGPGGPGGGGPGGRVR